MAFAEVLRPCANPTAWMPTCPDVDGQGFVFRRGDMSSSLHDLGASTATRGFRLRPNSPLPALGILPISTAVGARLDPAHRLGAKSDDDHCTGVAQEPG